MPEVLRIFCLTIPNKTVHLLAVFLSELLRKSVKISTPPPPSIFQGNILKFVSRSSEKIFGGKNLAKIRQKNCLLRRVFQKQVIKRHGNAILVSFKFRPATETVDVNSWGIHWAASNLVQKYQKTVYGFKFCLSWSIEIVHFAYNLCSKTPRSHMISILAKNITYDLVRMQVSPLWDK